MSSIQTRLNQHRPSSRESELLGRAQRGDELAFEQLAGAHVDRLFATALRLVGDRWHAEEIVQETLLRAWRGISGFRGRAQLSTWLHRIALNEAARSLEQGTRRPETIALEVEQLQVSSPPDTDPARLAEYRELRGTLRRALLALPVHYRVAVVLRDIEGLSTREAANIVGVGEAAFKSRLHQGRLELRAALGDELLLAAVGSQV